MIRKLSILLAALCVAGGVHAETWQARYGVAETFDFKLYNADGTLDVDEADGGTEVSVSCNEGAETTATNDFVDEGTFYSIALTAAEMQCERIAVVVAATTTEVFFIQTIDNTSAMTPTIVQTGDSFARLGAPAGASVSADIAVLDNFVDDLESRVGTPSNFGGGATLAANASDIEAQTDDIGAAGAGLTALATQASVNTIDDYIDTEVAAILDDTGTAGVVIAEATSNCREVLGCDTQGTLSGTHSATTADLGTNAPANTVAGMTLVIPTHNFTRVITAYDTGTGVATFDSTAVTLANGNQYYLYATAPSSGATAPTAAQVADAVWDEDMTAHQTQGTAGQVLGDSSADNDSIWSLANTNLTATVGSRATQTSVDTVDDFVDTEIATLTTRLGTPTDLGGGASVAANLADIEGQTDDIGAAGAGLTAADDSVMARLGTPVGASLSADIAGVESGISWNSAWDAEVQSEANDALVANLLDQLLLTTYNPASPPGATDSLLEDLVENDAGVTRFSSNALEQAPTSGGGNMTQIEGIDATDQIDARVTAQINAYDPPTRAELTTDIGSVLTALSALPNSIRDIQVEDQGGGVTSACVQSVLLAFAAGDIVTAAGTTTWRDPSNGEIRITGTVTSNGNRTATITCPTL